MLLYHVWRWLFRVRRPGFLTSKGISLYELVGEIIPTALGNPFKLASFAARDVSRFNTYSYACREYEVSADCVFGSLKIHGRIFIEGIWVDDSIKLSMAYWIEADRIILIVRENNELVVRKEIYRNDSEWQSKLFARLSKYIT